MCYPQPGPRCSNHAKKTLTRATNTLRLRAADLKEASAALAKAEDSGKANDTVVQKRAEAYNNFIEARKDYQHNLREYVATPKGKADYLARLKEAEELKDSTKIKQIKSVIQQAGAIEGWRANALIKLKKSGAVAVSRKSKYHNDGSIKLEADSIGVITNDANPGGSFQRGKAHSVRFSSIDDLASVICYAYPVAMDSSGNIVDAASSDVSHYSFEQYRDSIVYASVEDRKNKNKSSRKSQYVAASPENKFSSVSEASKAAEKFVSSLESSHFSLHDSSAELVS